MTDGKATMRKAALMEEVKAWFRMEEEEGSAVVKKSKKPMY